MGGFRAQQYPYPYKTGDGQVDAELDEATIGLIEILPVGNVGTIRTLDQAFGMEIDTQIHKYIKMDIGVANTIFTVQSTGVTATYMTILNDLIVYNDIFVDGTIHSLGVLTTSNHQTARLSVPYTDIPPVNPTYTLASGAIRGAGQGVSPHGGYEYAGMVLLGNIQAAGNCLIAYDNYHPNWLFSLNYIGSVDPTGQYYSGPTINSETHNSTLNGGVSTFTIYGPPRAGTNVLTIGPIANALTVFGTTGLTGNLNVLGLVDVVGDLTCTGVQNFISTDFQVNCGLFTTLRGVGLSGTCNIIQPTAVNITSAQITINANNAGTSYLNLYSAGGINIQTLFGQITYAAVKMVFTTSGYGLLDVGSIIFHVLGTEANFYVSVAFGKIYLDSADETNITDSSLIPKNTSRLKVIQRFAATLSDTILHVADFQVPYMDPVNGNKAVINFGINASNLNQAVFEFGYINNSSPSNYLFLKLQGSSGGLSITDNDVYFYSTSNQSQTIIVYSSHSIPPLTVENQITATTPEVIPIADFVAPNMDTTNGKTSRINLGKNGGTCNQVNFDFSYFGSGSIYNSLRVQLQDVGAGLSLSGSDFQIYCSTYLADTVISLSSATVRPLQVRNNYTSPGNITTTGFYTPSLQESYYCQHFFGISETTNLAGFLNFRYTSIAAPTTNYIRLGIFGHNGITIDGSDNLIAYGNITATTAGSQFRDLTITANSSSVPLSVTQAYASPGHIITASFVANNLNTTYSNRVQIGVSTATPKNSGALQFYYDGSGSDANTMALAIDGTIGLYVDGNSALYVHGTIYSNSSTDASTYDGTTGAIKTIGGMSIAKSIYAGTNIFSPIYYSGNNNNSLFYYTPLDGLIIQSNLSGRLQVPGTPLLYYGNLYLYDATYQNYNTIAITTTAEATNFTGKTGSLCTTGGVSVKKSICCGGTLYFGLPSDSAVGYTYLYYTSGIVGLIINTDTVGQLSSGGSQTPLLYYGIAHSISSSYPTYNSIIIPLTADSTDTTGKTGSLCTQGGVSIAKTLYVGLSGNFSGAVNISRYQPLTLGDSYIFLVYSAAYDGPFLAGYSGGALGASTTLGISYNLTWDNLTNVTVVGTLSISSTTDSTSSAGTNGSLRTLGGASIAKKLYVGSTAFISSTTDASDASGTTGSIGTLGGVSIAKKLYVGSNTTISSTSAPTLALNLNTVTSGSIANLYTPSLATSNTTGVLIGKNVSSLNALSLLFAYTSSSSISNGVYLGLNGASNYLTINGSGQAALDCNIDATTSDGLSGTLQIIGGISISKTIWSGKSLNVVETTTTTDTELGHFFANALTNTHAAIIRFGRVDGSAECGNLYYRKGSTTTTNLISLNIQGTSGITIDGDSNLTIFGTTYSTGVMRVASTADSSDNSGTTGSFGTLGGASIAKKLYVGSTAWVSSTTDSSDASGTTGSLGTLGGVSIAKKLWVGGWSYLGTSSPFAYETASWTPVFTPSAGTITKNSGSLTGSYTRIGNTIMLSFYFDNYSYTLNTVATADMTITGSPYKPLNKNFSYSLGRNNAAGILQSGPGAGAHADTIVMYNGDYTLYLYNNTGATFFAVLGNSVVFYYGTTISFTYA